MNRKSIILLAFAAVLLAQSCQKENINALSSAYTSEAPVQLWYGGPFWASTNLCAEKTEDNGKYFAWGYNNVCNYFDSYISCWISDGNYRAFSGSDIYVTEWFPTKGFTDYKTHNFENQARYCWGGNWRLPTQEECQALLDNCTAEFTTKGGKKGVKFTGKGEYAGKSIFLPAAGYGEGLEWKEDNVSWRYWSSTELSSEKAWCLNISSDGMAALDMQPKYMGFSIRPVRDAKTPIPSGDLLPGLFTVNEHFKTVNFTRGNLYYTGKEFQFEKNQYDYTSTWDITHVSHFYSSPKASIAFAATYDGSGSSNNFILFTNETASTPDAEFTVNGTKGCFRALSRDEWDYILNCRKNAANLHKNGVTVCGQGNCLVLAPDGFSGTIQSSYDASTWQKAEAAGLVCLPPTGFRAGSYILKSGEIGLYKSSGTFKATVYSLYFRSGYLDFGRADTADNGGAIRLVMVN